MMFLPGKEQTFLYPLLQVDVKEVQKLLHLVLPPLCILPYNCGKIRLRSEIVGTFVFSFGQEGGFKCNQWLDLSEEELWRRG